MMKKNPKMLLAAIIVLGAIAFSACEKLKTEGPVSGFQYDTNSQIEYSKIENLNISAYRSGSGCEEILVFEDMETFKHAMNELERQAEEYDDAFVAYYSDLSEEELYQKEQEIAYNDVQPMTDFENYLDFRSSNADYLVAEAQYLDQEDLNDEDDPENHFIGEPEERTLLNACNEVMVNDTIYKLTEDGYFEISDGDFRKLAQLDEFGEELPENVRFIGEDNSSSMRMGGCLLKHSIEDSKYNDAKTKRVNWYLKKNNGFWDDYLTAKTKNFKKKRRGWRKYRTRAKAGVSGKGYADCQDDVPFVYLYEEKNKKRRKTVRKKIPMYFSNESIKSGDVKGYHYGAGGIEHHSVLIW